jgi:hypothetical protein
MKATATQVAAVRLAVDRRRRQSAVTLGDPTRPARRDAASRRDDRTHTPPHGDALLPRKRA